MTSKSLKAELYKELQTNQLELVIAKLRNIYDKSTEKYKELFSIAFQFNSLKSDNRKGILNKGIKNQEFNRIRNGLHLLIDELTEEDVFNYNFENDYSMANNATIGNSKSSGNEGWKRRVLNYLRYLKYSICLLLVMVLFVIDGMQLFKNHLPLIECDNRVELLSEQVETLVFRSNMNLALSKLEESISAESRFYQELNLVRGRYERNERGFNRKGIVEDMDYIQERQTIALIVLEISNDIECDDLA